VKTEKRTFSDIVKEGSKNSVTRETVHRAVKSAVSEDQRNRNLVTFGLQETTGKNLEKSVDQVVKNFGSGVEVKSCHRIGSSESATSVLVGANGLKTS
jgi:hypothetical protein